MRFMATPEQPPAWAHGGMQLLLLHCAAADDGPTAAVENVHLHDPISDAIGAVTGHLAPHCVTAWHSAC
eukprot:SAG31_NODE_1165_length_9578_cov_5.386011_5_plen_69_part_00